MPNSLYSDLCDVYDEGKKPYLFISYAHEDTTKVVAAIRGLQRLGYRIWYDMGISAGAQWPEDVADHIYGCDAVLAFMTPNSIQSDNCREELFYAKKCNKKILLAYLEKCDLSHGMDMRLGMLQAIERWRCKDDEEFYNRLAKEKILQPCRGEIQCSDAAVSVPGLASVPEKNRTEIEKLREKASKGDAQAQYDLGQAYDLARGVERNYREAAQWYLKSANQGHRGAQFSLGYFYEYGQGVHIDLEEAVKWYQKSAAQRNTTALVFLGKCYEQGKGVDTNVDEAFRCYQKAADLGNHSAQNLVGYCYEVGLGTPQDWGKAVDWYYKAGIRGIAYAQKKLAKCYREGLGVPVAPEEAAKWQKLYDENPNK